MKDNKHFDLSKATPGNWHWKIDPTTIGAILIWASTKRDKAVLLATVDDKTGDETAAANASLMAASYEMYTALVGCKDALSQAGLWTDEEPFMQRIDNVLKKITRIYATDSGS